MVFVFLIKLKRFDSRLAPHASYIINGQICLEDIDIVRYRCIASVAERTSQSSLSRQIKAKEEEEDTRFPLFTDERRRNLARVTMAPRIRQD